jgi:hypothetical protein
MILHIAEPVITARGAIALVDGRAFARPVGSCGLLARRVFIKREMFAFEAKASMR